MANAPRPGRARQEEARRQAERVAIRITLNGESYTLHIGDLGPQDDLVARKQVGLPVTPFFAEDRFGMDSLLIIYWMARRKSGESTLQFQAVLDEYPTYESVTNAGFQIEALEDDGEVDPGDPLPLAAASRTSGPR